MSDKEQSFDGRSKSTSPIRNNRKRAFHQISDDDNDNNYNNKNHRRKRHKSHKHKQDSYANSRGHSSTKSANKNKHDSSTTSDNKNRHNRPNSSDITSKSNISPKSNPTTSQSSSNSVPESSQKKLKSKKKKKKSKQRFIATKIIPGLSIDSYDEAPLNSDNSSFKFVYESNVINGINNISNILNDDNKSTKDIDFEETEIKLTQKELNKQTTKRTLTIIDMISWCLERSNGIHVLRNIKNLGRAHQRFKDLEPFLNNKIKTGKINRKQKERVITMVKWVIKILQNDNPDKGFVLESFYQRVQLIYSKTYNDSNENKNNIEDELLNDTDEEELRPLWYDIITKEFYGANKNKIKFKNENDNNQIKKTTKNKFRDLCFSYSPTSDPHNVN